MLRVFETDFEDAKHRLTRVVRFMSLLAPALPLVSCHSQDADITFVPDVAYDTVAVGGGAHETNPLLLYRTPVGIQLVDERTVLYADNVGGSLTTVDLMSGIGWQVVDGGADGPGEFGGSLPFHSESGGEIYTLIGSGQAATRSLDGTLVDARQFSVPPFDPHGTGFPMGILTSGVLVSLVRERPDWDELTPQTLRQALRAYSASDGFTDLPPAVVRVEERPGGGVRARAMSGDGVVADARDSTVVTAMNGEPWVLALNANGAIRARRELPYDVFSIRLDSDERVWVQVWATNAERTGSYLVLDRDLNTVMRVAERNVRDAFGDYVVAIRTDELDTDVLVLLGRRH